MTEILAKPVAPDLLFSDIPARPSYVGLDGDPRVVPTAFWWDGRITPDHVVLHDFETTIPTAVAHLIAEHGR